MSHDPDITSSAGYAAYVAAKAALNSASPSGKAAAAATMTAALRVCLTQKDRADLASQIP